MACADRESINPFESLRHGNSLPRSFSESAKRLAQAYTINSGWKITISPESW